MTTPAVAVAADRYPGDASDLLLVNRLARGMPWLHAAMVGYASSGVALFVVLIGFCWWVTRRRADPHMAEFTWTALGMLAAVGINSLSWVSPKRPRARRSRACWC